MRVRPEHLTALLACVDEGTFDGAAALLRVTPSAISQRIKALEQTVGQLVLIRSVPVQPTEVGAVLLRSARQRALLDADLTRALAPSGVRGSQGQHSGLAPVVRDLPVAVNADSLATWFPEVIAEVARWPDVRLRLRVADQDQTERLLRDGSVMGAVTASSRPVQGCSIHELGVMRYEPRVTVETWERCGRDLTRLPSVRFDADDDLQRMALQAAGVTSEAVEHVVPSAEGFVHAVAAGLGWGLVPAGMEPDGLLPVPGLTTVDVPLFWQCWRLDVGLLTKLTDEVTSAAYRLA